MKQYCLMNKKISDSSPQIFLLLMLMIFIMSSRTGYAETLNTQSQSGSHSDADATLACDQIVSYTAKTSDMNNSILIQWQTESENNLLGFHIWRSQSDNDVYARLTQDPVPAKGGTFWGADYTYEDIYIVPDTTYYYKLQVIGENQVQRFYGPISSDGLLIWDGCHGSDTNEDDDEHYVIVHCFISTLFY